MTNRKPLTSPAYVASPEQHGAALGRALAYCLLHGLGKVSYEQLEGTVHGVEHGRVRFVFEVDSAPFFTAMTELRERFGLPSRPQGERRR